MAQAASVGREVQSRVTHKVRKVDRIVAVQAAPQRAWICRTYVTEGCLQ